MYNDKTLFSTCVVPSWCARAGHAVRYGCVFVKSDDVYEEGDDDGADKDGDEGLPAFYIAVLWLYTSRPHLAFRLSDSSPAVCAC